MATKFNVGDLIYTTDDLVIMAGTVIEVLPPERGINGRITYRVEGMEHEFPHGTMVINILQHDYAYTKEEALEILREDLRKESDKAIKLLLDLGSRDMKVKHQLKELKETANAESNP